MTAFELAIISIICFIGYCILGKVKQKEQGYLKEHEYKERRKSIRWNK
jgi:hypothetical protein